VLEKLSLKAAYCVDYSEQFASGDDQSGAYTCELTLSDPGGWTLLHGGPTLAFATPAAGEDGGPDLERETDNDLPAALAPSPHFATPVGPSAGLAAVLGRPTG
jgi:hypothetical protein